MKRVMSGKESDKKGKLVTEKRSVPNLDRSKAADHPSKRKSKRFHKYQTPCFGAVSKGLETDPPGFPPLDLVSFDDPTSPKGRGDASAGSSEPQDGPSSPRPEFKITREDFPALPGTGGESRRSAGDEPFDRRKGKSGSAARADGRVTDVPKSMLRDQFGVAGLLSFLRASERDDGLRTRGFGEDLTGYGFDLNCKKFLHPDFYGPFSDRPSRPQDVDYDVPKEYLHHKKTKKKLPPVDFSRYEDDTLFYLFYTFVGDYKQLAAAARLYDKDWRFHTEENYWMSLVTQEKNCYCFFDPTKWCKVRVVDYEIDVEKLAGRPRMPEIDRPSREPDGPVRFRPFVPSANVPAARQTRSDRNVRPVRRPMPPPAKCVRPCFPRYVEIDRVAPCRGIPTFFAPRLPMPAPNFPIVDPYAGCRFPDVYARQRHVRTLYAPAPLCLPEPENENQARRRRKY